MKKSEITRYMKKLSRTISILIVLVLFGVTLTACGPSNNSTVETDLPVVETADEPVVTDEPVETEELALVYEEQPFGGNLPTESTINTPFVIAYPDFSQKFSPFFSESESDADVVGMTQISLLTTDRVGGIVNNAIEGEIRSYNGVDYLYKGAADTSVNYDEIGDTTVYTAKLRVGIKFSDGKPVTADDVIFTYYTILILLMTGPNKISSFDIIGLKDYQTQTTSEVFDKYDAIFEEIYAAGMDHEYAEVDGWTEEQQNFVNGALKDGVLAEVEAIVTFNDSNNRNAFAEVYIGKTPEEVANNEGLKIALGMALGLW